MSAVRKIDDIGRIAIPKDMRQDLQWWSGDQIKVTQNEDGSITLKKYNEDATSLLEKISKNWENDLDVSQQFLDLINLIKSKTE